MTNNYNLDRTASPVEKELNHLSDCWNIFLPNDTNYWLYCDLNQQHFQSAAEHGSADMFLLLPHWANLFLDFLIFHSLADYLIRLLLTDVPVWLLLLSTCLFPFLYMAIELKFAQLIHAAKMARRDEPFDGLLTFWVIFWYVTGFCWAVLPSAMFAYTMYLSQSDSQLSWIFVAIMTALGVLLHLLIVFGGEPVIAAKTRWFACRTERKLATERLKSYRALRKAVGRAKSTTSHYAQIATTNQMNTYFFGLTESATSIIRFVDREYYSLHPLDRPFDYRFGKYRRDRSDRLPGA
ncbi:hypothetical protein [Chamaesiphon sp. GL140_3_metabinner_50]|uniref:hypothetical protein n=1 Tax=Chamaesiphon sp. GL140_3_metabinner_50 TaxID=2970812 RepID=UPI0025F18407|nr:hypothetical protein [Chamaesiphon sp. GL140_3_metabinner_50]